MIEQEKKTPVTEEAPLTPAKKRALIEYMGILFAAAFLLVAVSLFLKMDAMQDDFNVANQGARENIKLMESRLTAAEAENDALTADLEVANAENGTLTDALEAANIENESLTAALETAVSEKDALTNELASADRAVAATELLVQAYQALEAGDTEAFARHMAALESCADALSPEMQDIYAALLEE